MQPKSHEELAALEWANDTRRLQDAILALPKTDPGRALLQADLEARFVEKYGNAAPVATGGAVLRTTKGAPPTLARTLTFQGGQRGGYRVEEFKPSKEQAK